MHQNQQKLFKIVNQSYIHPIPLNSLRELEQNYKPIPFHQDTIFWSFISLCSTPGFKKEDLKVQVDTLGRLTVSGERRLDEGKYTRFKKVFEVPTDSNLDKITGKFEHSILSVIMPLKEGAASKKEEPQMENATQTQEPKKENAATGKESAKIEEKPAKKEEPKKEDAATGKESSKKEEKPAQKEEPKKEDAADGKESTKKEEIKSADKEKEKEKPKREDAETGKDRTKKEEKPMTQNQEPKKDNGATKKEEKLPMQKLKEEAKKEDGVKFGSGSCCTKEGTKKAEAEGDKLGQRKKQEGGCVDDTTKEEKGWRRRNEQKETMVMEREEEEEETGLLERVKEQINKNKVAIAAAALAFSFGVYLSRKLRSN